MVDAAFNSSNSVCHGNGLSAHLGIDCSLRTHLFVKRQDRHQVEELHWSSHDGSTSDAEIPSEEVVSKFHRGMGDAGEPDDK